TSHTSGSLDGRSDRDFAAARVFSSGFCPVVGLSTCNLQGAGRHTRERLRPCGGACRPRFTWSTPRRGLPVILFRRGRSGCGGGPSVHPAASSTALPVTRPATGFL